MDTLHAKADWERVGDRWFRKTQQYTDVFDEDLDLSNYIVAGAPYGGALGMNLTSAKTDVLCRLNNVSVNICDRWTPLMIKQHCGAMSPSSILTKQESLESPPLTFIVFRAKRFIQLHGIKAPLEG